MKTGQCVCVLVLSFYLMCLYAHAEDSPEQTSGESGVSHPQERATHNISDRRTRR